MPAFRAAKNEIINKLKIARDQYIKDHPTLELFTIENEPEIIIENKQVIDTPSPNNIHPERRPQL
jgi:hypothetical protein